MHTRLLTRRNLRHSALALVAIAVGAAGAIGLQRVLPRFSMHGTQAAPLDWTLSPLYRERADQFARLADAHANSRPDLVMAGDSLTALAEWQEFLPGRKVLNRAIMGDTTEGLLLRLPAILRLNPAALGIMIGVNDFRMLRDTEPRAADRYREIVLEAAAAGTRVLIFSTLFTGEAESAGVNASVGDLNRDMAALCDGGSCEFVDLNSQISVRGAPSAALTLDRLHLNGIGYAKWAEILRVRLDAAH